MSNNAGKLYRPSNGTEGECFMAKFCDNCQLDVAVGEGLGCEILARTMAFDIDDYGYPREWTYDQSGKPVCTSFKGADVGN